MTKLFGTDGVRGKAGEFPMVPDFAMKLAQAAGIGISRVAIGRDTRISGQMLESAMVAGFASVGVDVVLLGVLPTPAMTSILASLNVDLGVMITASHNPYYDNGIKLMNGVGDKLSQVETSRLEDLLGDCRASARNDVFGGVVCNNKVVNQYLEKVSKIVPSLKGLRVVLDCANGAFSEILPAVFKDLGAGVIVLNNQPDGYNINKDCGSMHPEIMCKTVVESKAHLGIAVDGDGDRIIICDEKGSILDGDQIIAFLAKNFKESGKLKANAVVATIVSNFGLEKFCRSLGIDYYQTAVGEMHVIDKLKELGANVGGEESGHMVVTDYSKSGDGLVVGLIVASGLLQSGKKMSELFPVFEAVYKKRMDVKFAVKENMAKAIEKTQNVIEECAVALGNKGKILVRASGTEPKIQVWIWGEDKNLVDELNAKIASEIEKFIN